MYSSEIPVKRKKALSRMKGRICWNSEDPRLPLALIMAQTVEMPFLLPVSWGFRP